jgi:SAM-dependent methyltransferase
VTYWPYDLIAEFYDEDIGRNTDGRDVAWYVAQVERAVAALGGSVLEMGCGTGRVTLALAAAGLRVIALDRSLPMLRELVRKTVASECRHLIHPVAANMSRPGLGHRFAAIICPYSAFGYLVEADDCARMLAAVRERLSPDGILLLDMIIPDPAFERAEAEIYDYDRALPPGSWAPATRLVRYKRVIRLRPQVNRIERRYRFLDETGDLVREVRTQSQIRLYTAETLQAVLTEAGFTRLQVCGDFDASLPAAAPARVTTVIASL